MQRNLESCEISAPQYRKPRTKRGLRVNFDTSDHVREHKRDHNDERHSK